MDQKGQILINQKGKRRITQEKQRKSCKKSVELNKNQY
jgi:hypothetical protein